MKFFDSHAHYFDAWFNEYEGGAEALLEKLFSEQVGAVVNIATNPENLKECIAQAQKFEKMYVSSGIHPEDCLYIDNIDAALEEIEASVCNAEQRRANKIVAIGEIGFDYHLEELTDEVKVKQRYVFERQMAIAQKYGLPVIIHDREAHGDCFEMALKYPEVKGIFHSYSGSSEMARELLILCPLSTRSPSSTGFWDPPTQVLSAARSWCSLLVTSSTKRAPLRI